MVGGDFLCHCKGSLKGKRCERASVCEEDLCKNGGSCHSSMQGVFCDCHQGFEGRKLLNLATISRVENDEN